MSYMHYENAKKAAAEARSLIDPKKDPVMFDIAGALYSLAEGLQRDLRQIEQQLDSLERLIRSRAQ